MSTVGKGAAVLRRGTWSERGMPIQSAGTEGARRDASRAESHTPKQGIRAAAAPSEGARQEVQPLQRTKTLGDIPEDLWAEVGGEKERRGDGATREETCEGAEGAAPAEEQHPTESGNSSARSLDSALAAKRVPVAKSSPRKQQFRKDLPLLPLDRGSAPRSRGRRALALFPSPAAKERSADTAGASAWRSPGALNAVACQLASAFSGRGRKAGRGITCIPPTGRSTPESRRSPDGKVGEGQQAEAGLTSEKAIPQQQHTQNVPKSQSKELNMKSAATARVRQIPKGKRVEQKGTLKGHGKPSRASPRTSETGAGAGVGEEAAPASELDILGPPVVARRAKNRAWESPGCSENNEWNAIPISFSVPHPYVQPLISPEIVGTPAAPLFPFPLEFSTPLAPGQLSLMLGDSPEPSPFLHKDQGSTGFLNSDSEDTADCVPPLALPRTCSEVSLNLEASLGLSLKNPKAAEEQHQRRKREMAKSNPEGLSSAAMSCRKGSLQHTLGAQHQHQEQEQAWNNPPGAARAQVRYLSSFAEHRQKVLAAERRMEEARRELLVRATVQRSLSTGHKLYAADHSSPGLTSSDNVLPGSLSTSMTTTPQGISSQAAWVNVQEQDLYQKKI